MTISALIAGVVVLCSWAGHFILDGLFVLKCSWLTCSPPFFLLDKSLIHKFHVRDTTEDKWEQFKIMLNAFCNLCLFLIFLCFQALKGPSMSLAQKLSFPERCVGLHVLVI